MSKLPGPPQYPWKYIQSLPLHFEPISGHPLAEKISNTLAALESGADPNELDKAPRAERSIGRPLHYATDSTHFDFGRRYENFPIVELLLKYGADPRLPGMEGLGGRRESALEEVRDVVKSNSPKVVLRNLTERDIEFFKRALEAMEEKAKELDGEHLCFAENNRANMCL